MTQISGFEMVQCWYIDTPYDGANEDHWQSQNRLRAEFYRLNGVVACITLLVSMAGSGSSGYFHRWRVFDEQHAFNFHLAYGSAIRKDEYELKKAAHG